MLKHLMFGVLALTLIGCPLDVEPKDADLDVRSGESIYFRAVADQPYVDLVWTLDGQQVAVGQEYILVAVNESDEPIIRQLTVAEEGGPASLHHTATWTITIQPEGCCLDGDLVETPCGVGACAAKGTMTCLNCEWSDNTCVPGPPTPEVCDGIDNDCDGAVDDSIAAVLVMCPDGRTCAMECRSYQYNCCDEIPPFPEEVCDGLDNDCDGMVDEGLDDCQPVAAPAALKAQPNYCTGN